MAFALFEENGDLKSGTILADNGTSLQIELVTGRRAKVKATHIYLRFESPLAEELLPEAQRTAEAIDVDFLWECAPGEEFGFDTLAADYFGGQPTAVQSTALLTKLKSAPIYFQRKGRGRFKAAPEQTVHAALAAVKKREEQELQIQKMADDMVAGELPATVQKCAAQLLTRPDKMSLEFKALDRALTAAGKTPMQMLFDLGAFATDYALHIACFAAEQFPRGVGFDEKLTGWQPSDGLLSRIDALPVSDVVAFSIDDSSTTEIDDALSVQLMGDGRHIVGVHIAAPSLAISPGDEIDNIVRDRMSTVYMPGDKITMLAPSVVDSFSLDAGRQVPVVSLYVQLDENGTGFEKVWSALEQITVADNLRDDHLDTIVTEAALEDPQADLPHGDALRVLWKLMHGLLAHREQVRGKPEPRFRTDFIFSIVDDVVSIAQRRRDAPLSRLVAEMMILANSQWGRMLAEASIAGIYRSQQAGRVRMSSQALPHDGIGVAQYMWATSPLRRYIDLVNQRQLIAMIEQTPPALEENSADLFSIIPSFEARHSAYQAFQQNMERYWCMRWLGQRRERQYAAVVVRDELVRMAQVPLYFRLDSTPPLAPGRRIIVDIDSYNPLDLTVSARYIGLDESFDDPPVVASDPAPQ
ncbi:MAG: RNB domain-containing ribonuclease [Burkholderiaceae bacterium]